MKQWEVQDRLRPFRVGLGVGEYLATEAFYHAFPRGALMYPPVHSMAGTTLAEAGVLSSFLRGRMRDKQLAVSLLSSQPPYGPARGVMRD